MRNTKLISLACILLLAPVAFAASTNVLTFDFNLNKDGSVEVVDIHVLPGETTESSGTGYSLELLSSAGEALHTINFAVSFQAHVHPLGMDILPGQEPPDVPIELDQVRMVVNAPYLEDATSFRIKKGAAVLLEGSLNLCNGDGTCQFEGRENYPSCPSDCPSGTGDGYCDGIFDEKCDPDCEAQGRKEKDTDCTCGDGACSGREDSFYCAQDCGAPPMSSLLVKIIGAGVVLFLIIIVLPVALLIRRRRRKKRGG